MQKIKKFFVDNKYIALMLLAAALYVVVLREFFGIIAAPLEIIAVVFTIIEFDLFRRQKHSAFIFNIVRCTLLAIWFLSIGLYGQVAFRILFAIGSIVGLFIWTHPGDIKKKKKKELAPSALSNKLRLIIYPAILIFGLIMLLTADIITLMDWMFFACGAIGNVLILFKKKDAWFLWLATDLIGVPLFFLTGSWMYLLVTVFMIGVEIAALKSWRVKNDRK